MRRYSFGELRELIRRALSDCPGFGRCVDVDGKIRHIDQGIWHFNYWFWIRGRDVPAGRSEQAYILRILDQREDWQQGPDARDRLLREADTLQVLQKVDFLHVTPEFICFVEDDEGETVGMIETACPGCSLERSKDRSTLQLAARVAADVHRLAPADFGHLPTYGSKTEHVRSQLAAVDEAVFDEFPTAKEVRAWIEGQTFADDRPCVLHGDLLPQNLLRDWLTADQEEPPVAVVEWEMATIGDPASDLAIVSRGNRKVLGKNYGLKALVQDYLEYGGQTLSISDVHLHELLLVLLWLEESWREYQKPEPSGHGPGYYETKLNSLFRRTIA